MMLPFRATLVLVALLQGGPLLAQTTFKYKFKTGETTRYELTIGHKLTHKADDKEFNGLEKQIITMTWKVESVDEKGAAKIRLTVDRVKLVTEQGKESTEVSSDAKEPDKEPAKSMYPLAKALAKFDGYFTMAADGQIGKVTIPEETKKAMKSVPGADKAEPMTEDALKATLRSNTFVFGEEMLTKGKSWKEKIEVTTPFGKYAGDLVFTYDGMVPQGGVTAAKFVVKPQIKIEPDTKVKVMLKNVDSAATIYFDPAAGQLLEVTSTQVMELAGEDNGKKVSNRTESTNTLKRVK